MISPAPTQTFLRILPRMWQSRTCTTQELRENTTYGRHTTAHLSVKAESLKAAISKHADDFAVF